jgi:hypothetical protein
MSDGERRRRIRKTICGALLDTVDTVQDRQPP